LQLDIRHFKYTIIITMCEFISVKYPDSRQTSCVNETRALNVTARVGSLVLLILSVERLRTLVDKEGSHPIFTKSPEFNKDRARDNWITDMVQY
jgi:hypothetical protein